MPSSSLMPRAVLDNTGYIVYYSNMGSKKQRKLQWTPDQINTANLLAQDKNDEEIMKLLDVGKTMVVKVKGALASGDYPPNTKEAADKLATSKGKPKSDKPSQPKLKTTDALSETSLLQMIPQVQQLPLTPDIFMSYMCALKNGYTGTIAQWLSLVSRDFWLGRGRNFYEEVSEIDAIGEKGSNDGSKEVSGVGVKQG